MYLMILMFFLIGLFMIFIALTRLNVIIIKHFLDKKDEALLDHDPDLIELNDRFMIVNTNLEFARKYSWYVSLLEIVVLGAIFFCIYLRL